MGIHGAEEVSTGFEREQARRLNAAYARWHEKHRELLHAVGDREQERRLLETRERERNDHREE